MQHSRNTISCGVMSRTQTFRLGAMDKVRLGRALGYGARHAAKSLLSAADAATSPDPNPRTKAANAHPVAQVVETVRQVSQAKAHAKKQVGRAVLGPLKTFSSVIWLQVTGTFFGLFALTMGGAVIRHRDYFRLPIGTEDGRKIYFYVLVFVIFAYFTVSNFVRANRRQKQ
jgi:hypothetical protein